MYENQGGQAVIAHHGIMNLPVVDRDKFIQF